MRKGDLGEFGSTVGPESGMEILTLLNERVFNILMCMLLGRTLGV